MVVHWRELKRVKDVRLRRRTQSLQLMKPGSIAERAETFEGGVSFAPAAGALDHCRDPSGNREHGVGHDEAEQRAVTMLVSHTPVELVRARCSS